MTGSATMVDVSARTDEQWQGRLDHLGRIVLVPLLAVSVVMAWLSERGGYGSAHRLHLSLLVAGVAAVWTVGITMRAIGRRTSMPTLALGFIGHTALAAVLVDLNPWFGIFGYTGYMLANRLPGLWSKLGIVLTAFIMAGSEMAGFPFHHSGSWPGYLIVAAINATLLLVFIDVTDRVLAQNAERGRMITELNETNDRLSAALAENAGLHAQLVAQAREAGVQDERQRLAGEIHDTLAQGLTGIVTQLAAADQARHLPAEWQRHLDQARDLARAGLTEARRSVRALRPEQLEHAGLVDAVEELTRAWTHTTTIPVRVEATGPVRPLSSDIEAALFRVGQEALTNVAKHAHASKVALTLTYLDDVVVLDVRDDGVGWSGAPRPGSYGLDSMRARLDRVGGHLEIETAPSEGSVVSASVPVSAG
jgi:signal transduction histidine kinase